MRGFILVMGFLAVGCKHRVEKAEVIGHIVEKFKDKGLAVTLDCPDAAWTKDTSVTCTGVNTADHRSFEVTVKIVDDDGGVDWQLVGKIVTPDKFATDLDGLMSEKLGKPAKLACPSALTVLAPGDEISCPVTVDAERLTAKITVAANGNDVTWEIRK